MKKRKLKKRIRALERMLDNEICSLTGLYRRVEKLEGQPVQFKSTPIPFPDDNTTWPKPGRNWSATLEIIG